jgi:uncharacterized membrane protein (UPF0127 family)
VSSFTLPGDVVVPVEVADTRLSRRRGLLGRVGIDGALLLQPAFAVHTLGMQFDIDVAYLDKRMVVIDFVTMRRGRVGRPRWRARAVLEAEAGSFARWNLERGDRLVLS